MPALAFETRLVLAVQSRIKELSEFNSLNCIWVPDFIEPLATAPGPSVQIRNPSITVTGVDGGAYLQRAVIDIGIFYRTSADPRYKWDKILTEVNDLSFKVRKQIIERGYSELSLYLYESAEQSTRPLIIGPTGQQVKEVVWAAIQVWGQKAQSTAEVLA